jgi:precorrin-3B methylase
LASLLCKNPTKNLETKWGMIKHDVIKFCDSYQAMAIFNKSSESFENTLQKVLELFKAKHPKQGLFILIHCWLIINTI